MWECDSGAESTSKSTLECTYVTVSPLLTVSYREQFEAFRQQLLSRSKHAIWTKLNFPQCFPQDAHRKNAAKCPDFRSFQPRTLPAIGVLCSDGGSDGARAAQQTRRKENQRREEGKNSVNRQAHKAEGQQNEPHNREKDHCEQRYRPAQD